MQFKDRQDAGRQLARALREYSDGDSVIYALPRGGVVLGSEIANTLHIPLDLVITRKIGHPSNPEYAICAVSEDGELVCNEVEKAFVNKDWLKNAVAKEVKEAARRREVYLRGIKHIPATNITAIVVDDGVATGLTIKAALQSLRKEKPKKLMVAIPVAPHDTLNELRGSADEVVVLEDAKDYLGAVGAYYAYFPQVTDEEVIKLLTRL
ncbi:MAG: phosphoribosyl transferase [Candidatus Colwellbacteria bacterium GWA2_46_10]|uniref:Phosphoribosyl transferase n=1 Tax=Candidatus Colwellbacteria bacterium GWA2_46_10 TaxID=1797684 RepID=A0A1G1YXA1_9BACT|nr:MAG: phosphoribosyl transferase [Candidatus Colwellbacteria bacterium GWA2_46_10]